MPRTVIGLGVVSLFTDVSSEAIFPLLPGFLALLGASNAAIGLIEGLADLVASGLKYLIGRAADRRARLKPLILIGYGISTVFRPLVALALSPWHVLAVRVGDRVGKGIRTSPRDALIAAVTPESMRGRAFGFHRAMDHAGAALGTLLGMGLLWGLGATSQNAATSEQLRTVFAWAAVPGGCALIALALTREPARPAPPLGSHEPRQALPLPAELRRALIPVALFALANASDAFLLVKAARLGAPPIFAPLLWLVVHVIKASTATLGGRLSDRFGTRNALALGWTVYAVTWTAVGQVDGAPGLFAVALPYAVSHGLVEGPEKALIAELAPAHARGSAFGVYNLIVGLMALLASTSFGALWDDLGGRAAFAASGACALAAALALLVLVRGPLRSRV